MRADSIKAKLPILITATVGLILYIAAGLSFDNFFSLRVFANLFSDNAFLGVVAIGLTFVILTGGIDLSVGSMVGCTSIMCAALMKSTPMHPGLIFGAALAFGAGVGAMHGFLISRFSLPPFLVTLAGLFLCRGIALRISQESIQVENTLVTGLASWSLALPGKASLTLSALILFATFFIALYLARQTRFGRTVYAIGGNANSAKLMGLPVKRTLFLTYTLSGFCGALGGIVFLLYTSSGNALSGTGLELDAIAATVIGGTLLTGGYGSVFGTLLGVSILGIVQTAITFQGTLSSWWTKIFIGALLLAFMVVQRLIEVGAARRTRGQAG